MQNEINNLRGFGKFIVDTHQKVLWHEETIVKLPLKAVELLCVLIEREGEIVSKADLLDEVWQDSFVEEGILSQNVYRLRQAFKKYADETDLIQTIPGRGYRFSGEINEVIEQQISIERSTYEKKFVTEKYTSDEGFAPANGNLTKDVSAKQIPSQTLNKSIGKSPLAYFAIILLSFSVIGAGVWFWKSKNSNQRNLSLINDNLTISRLTESGKAFYPAISRDNQNLAYVRNEKNTYSLILRHTATGSETVVIEPKEYIIRSLNFSADGNYIYYTTRERKNHESTIYQIPIYGGNRRKIVDNVRDYFSISPDGKKLAFFRYDPIKDETYLITTNTVGENEKVITTRKSPEFFQTWGTYPSWSPDGKTLVVSAISEMEGGSKSYFVEVDVETGKENALKHPNWKLAFQAYWINDGSGLIVSAEEKAGDYRQLWYLSYPEGKANRITNDTNNYTEFKLSNDSNTILAQKINSVFNLYTVSTEPPEQVKKLTSQTNTTYGYWGIDWTKDGKYLVYVKGEGRTDGNLWKLDLETLKDEQITFDKNVSNRSPQILPDNKTIIYTSNRSGNKHIWQIDLDGKNSRQITNGKSWEDYPEVSADGKWLFYCTRTDSRREIWKMNLASGKSKKVLDSAGGESRISPADSNQAIAHYFDTQEKEKRPWKYMLFSHDRELDLRRLNIDPEAHSFEWKKDGTGIYYPNKSRNQNNLWFYSIKDNETRQITNFNDEKIVNLSVSPDDKTIALSKGVSTGNILQITGFNTE